MRREQFLIPLVREIVKRPRLARAFFRFDKWGNPFGADAVEDPMILAPAMRKDGPVHWHPIYQQWFIMGYDEAREVLGSPSTGTAHQMTVLLDVRPYSQLAPATRAFLKNLMLLTDPPLHTRLRGLVNRAFTPRQVSRLEDHMGELVDGLLADLGDEVELINDVAVPFPAMVIAELFGFRATDWKWLQRLSVELTKSLDPIRAFEPKSLDHHFNELRERVLALAEERRLEPRDDLMTALVQAEDDEGDRLTDDELVSVSGIILIAGYETTSSMLGLSLLNLRRHPDQMALLQAEPTLWPNAVEELLRFDPPVRSDPRTALEDFEIAGKVIKKSQNIVVLGQMANRDLRRFPDADELRVDREDPAPLSFGHGIHYCLGASLARAELRIALPRLIAALADYEIDHDGVRWRESITVRGPSRLPLIRERVVAST